ncbi:uncharacterized protein LOC143732969 [Siphateles boraxobius]|uniref:uncharacterized protein LOC143732969 n=1 Tax=Siphateles boraxobius TaxID=180520 RepID=UPI004062F397
MDMMAENTDDNVPQNNTRQSMDDPPDFHLGETSVEITDASMSENISENQKQKTFSARWDAGISDCVFIRNDSISSNQSCDSGYASRKCTGTSDFFEKDEEKCQLQTRPAAQTKSTPKM